MGIENALDVFELPRTGVSQDWLANGLTLWNTHLTGGNALFAQQSNTPFGIDVALTFVIGPFGAYVTFVWLLAAAAGVSMHLFLRDSLPGVLVLTDVMAPGWVADRDGRTVPIASVDATFRGVAVDSATREVVFRYAPAFTYAGFAVAGVSLALMVAWALAVRQHYWRRPPPGASGTDYGTW